MEFTLRRWHLVAIGALSFSALAFTLGLGIGQDHPIIQTKVETRVETKIEKEWVIPARFNGQGAFTIGCRYFDTASLNPYSDENPNTQLAGLSLGIDGELEAILDGPNGTLLVHARECGISADWRAFPLEQRPGEFAPDFKAGLKGN